MLHNTQVHNTEPEHVQALFLYACVHMNARICDLKPTCISYQQGSVWTNTCDCYIYSYDVTVLRVSRDRDVTVYTCA
jgi:hypothetical protein